MKKIPFLMAMAATFHFLFIGCGDKMNSTVTYTLNEPVYMPYNEFRSVKALKPAQALVNPGKICLYGDYLYINEIAKGIHIVDNSNPAAPKVVAFMEVIGNIDITVSNNILYADSYIDLVWFDVTNPAQPAEIGRVENVFANALPPTDNDYLIKEIDWTKGVIVDWEVKTVTEKEEYRPYPPYYPCPECYNLASAEKASWGSAGRVTSSGTNFTSITGSMSRFAVYDNYLYVVNSNMLKVFSLSGNTVVKENEQYLSWNVETVFPYDQKLFLGTTSGLLIYGLTDPAKPAYLSSLAHVVGCDPVVVQGDYAYVTIRGGNICGQTTSFLDVIDISNPSAPVIKASFNMKEPYGLGIDGNTLFVCDEGLAIFNATNPLLSGALKIKHFTAIHGFDVIPCNGTLIMIGNDGLYQYDYSDIQDIKELSVIRIELKP